MVPNALNRVAEELPWSLREQVIGYARSVDYALPEIFKEANIKFDQEISNKVVFLSGIKKLYSIVSSSYWAIDNSGKLLNSINVEYVTAGSLDLSVGGEFHKKLKTLLGNIDRILTDSDLNMFLSRSYKDIVKELYDYGHR